MPTIFENLRRTAYQRPYMQSYKDPFSSRNDNTNWRGWTEPGRWGAQRSSMLSLDQFPGQSAAERVAPRNAFNQLNPLSGSGPFQSTYTPGVGYKSFEEALAVGKEARTKQDVEDYERYAAALGVSVTAEGFAQYSNEKGAERGLETSTAQKNAEIARNQANKNREYVLDVLTADAASRAQFRAQQISAQKETNRQDRWQEGGSYGSYGSSGTSRRGGTRTNNTATQAITAVGSGAFNDANERQVANYLIKAGVNQYQFDTGMANWSNRRRTFGRGEYTYDTGKKTPAEKEEADALQQEKDITDLVGRGDITGLKDMPVDLIPPGRRAQLERLIEERRQSTLTNRKAYQDAETVWANMQHEVYTRYNEQNSNSDPDIAKKDGVFQPEEGDWEKAVSETRNEKWLMDYIKSTDWVQGSWKKPTWNPVTGDVGEDLDSVNPFIIEEGSGSEASRAQAEQDKIEEAREFYIAAQAERAAVKQAKIEATIRRGEEHRRRQDAYMEANMTDEDRVARDQKAAAEEQRVAEHIFGAEERAKAEDLRQAEYRAANPDNPSVVRQYAAEPGLADRDRALVDEATDERWAEGAASQKLWIEEQNKQMSEMATKYADDSQMWFDQGDYLKAKELARTALQLNPENQVALNILAMAEEFGAGAFEPGGSSLDIPAQGLGGIGSRTPGVPQYQPFDSPDWEEVDQRVVGRNPDGTNITATTSRGPVTPFAPEPEVVQQPPPPSPLQFDSVKEAQIFAAEAQEFLNNRDWESAGWQAEEALRLDPNNQAAALILEFLKKNVPNKPVVGPQYGPQEDPRLPAQPATPLTAPEPQPAAPPAEPQTSFLPDDSIPYERGKNVWFGDPSPGRLTPAWGSQVVGPHLKSPNWEMFKTSLGSVATAPFESAKGLTYGVNEWITNPLLSLAEEGTAAAGNLVGKDWRVPFTDYRARTEDIFQDRGVPVMNPTAYTKDGRKPRVMTKRAMEELYPIFEKAVEAAMVAQGYSQQDLDNAASEITRQTVAKLLSEFEVVDKENFYRALNLE